jgi:tRNA threonylcarbamoyl adenosine modification protein YeaZ
MRILALDAALAQCTAAVVADQTVLASHRSNASQGHPAMLSAMAKDVLTESATTAASLDLVAVIVGPGSFTGIRAGIALAHGIGLAVGVPVVGVTVGEALADSLPHLGTRELWVAIDNRRGRIFLERDGKVIVASLDELPIPDTKVAVAGNVAAAVAATLAARDSDVVLTDARFAAPRHVAIVAERRWKGELRPLPPHPLYVEPPQARPPIGGFRPGPIA